MEIYHFNGLLILWNMFNARILNILLGELSLPVESCICIAVQFSVLNVFLCLERVALSYLFPITSCFQLKFCDKQVTIQCFSFNWNLTRLKLK